MKTRGFTLLEILVVIAVIAILLGIATPSYLRWRDASLLRQAQMLVSTELTKERTTAKRTNSARAVTWTATTFNGKTLDGGVKINETPQTITFVQPYGTLKEDASGSVPEYEITLKKGSLSAVVRVTGVFGKPIAKAVY